jgi:Fe(3+) dicitrate transport protein
LLTCIFDLSFAQNAQIKGLVLDHLDFPIEKADVYLDNTIRHVQTNEKGSFVIENIQAGRYNLKIVFLGYKEQIISFEVGKIDQYIEVKLQQEVYDFQEIHVTATRTDGRHLGEVEGMSINATKKNELIRLNKIDANLAMNNGRQIFAKVPGISIWESDGSGIQMSIASRGLNPNRSWEFNTRLNGYDITPDPMGYPEAYYTPPAEVVEKIEIVRGAAALQYGPQFGGLLNFVLRKPDLSTKFTFESQNTLGSNGLLSTFNYVGGTLGRFSYTTFYQKRIGNGWRQNSQFNTDHAHLQLGYAVTEKLKFGAELTYMDYVSQQAGGLTDSLYTINAQQSVRARNWFSAPWFVPAITADYIFNNETKLSFKTFATFGERSSIGFVKAINIADDNAQRQIDRDFYQNFGGEVRFITSYSLFGKKHTVVSGLRYFEGNTTRQQVGPGDAGNEYNTSLVEGKLYSRDMQFDNDNAAAFTENVIRFNKKLLMTAGLRYEHIKAISNGRLGFVNGQAMTINNLIRNRNFLLFGAGLEYHTTPNQEFYTNISQAYRPILFSDLTPPSTSDIIDQNLSDAKGYNIDFGYRGRLGNYLTFDVDYFFISYNNRVGTIATQNDEGKIVQYRTNLGNSISKGYEIFVEVKPFSFINNKKYGNLNAFASLAGIDAKYGDFKTTSVVNGQVKEINLKGNQVENAPRHIRRYGITYAYKTASVTWQLSDIGQAFADASNTIKPNATATIGLIPAYRVQDISATVKAFKYYIIKGGINNVANTKYFTRRAGGYPGPGILPADGRTFYVSLGLKF